MDLITMIPTAIGRPLLGERFANSSGVGASQ